MGYNLLINEVYWGYNLHTNLYCTSFDLLWNWNITALWWPLRTVFFGGGGRGEFVHRFSWSKKTLEFVVGNVFPKYCRKHNRKHTQNVDPEVKYGWWVHFCHFLFVAFVCGRSSGICMLPKGNLMLGKGKAMQFLMSGRFSNHPAMRCSQTDLWNGVGFFLNLCMYCTSIRYTVYKIATIVLSPASSSKMQGVVIAATSG